jgi:hypothetical protein
MRSGAVILVAALGACAGARAGRVAFVEGVYRSYDPAGPAAEPPWGERRCRTAFSEGLCALLDADRRQAGGEVGRLDGDPLYDAQDISVTGLTFAELAGGVVRASFRIGAEARRVDVVVVPAGEGWRIDDVRYVDEKPPTTLRDILVAK